MVAGTFKDVCAGKMMSELVELRAKTYNYASRTPNAKKAKPSPIIHCLSGTNIKNIRVAFPFDKNSPSVTII